jgi:acyl-CoA reductase-like NAD-dependent aldehyde dehydrogenase
MDQEIARILDLGESPAALGSAAALILERARWAAASLGRLDRGATLTIAEAVADAAAAAAGPLAELVVSETGRGVAAHQKATNERTSRGLLDHYRGYDLVAPRLDPASGQLQIPKPHGVVLAFIPWTNPIGAINSVVLSAVLTRNAVVLVPHPAAVQGSTVAIERLVEAATRAGLPEAAIQLVAGARPALLEVLLRPAMTDLVLAIGDAAPAAGAGAARIGRAHGNAPVFVDATADPAAAVERIVAAKLFDNGLLGTSESVVICLDAGAAALEQAFERAGAYRASPAETEALRRLLGPKSGAVDAAVGRDAGWIAGQAGFAVPPRTTAILARIDELGTGEPLSAAKRCPVLGLYVAPGKAQAIGRARALLRLAGRGHTAAIHSRDPQTILDFAMTVEAERIIVNAPASPPAFGFGPDLPGDVAIGPEALVRWVRVTLPADDGEGMPDLAAARPHFPGPLPEAPTDGVPGKSRLRHEAARAGGTAAAPGGGR